MALKMDAYRLLKDELQYELFIRGLTTSGTCAELRKRLHRALRDDVTPLDHIILGIDAHTELKTCSAKTRALENEIDGIDESSDHAELKRLDSRLCHLLHRVSRVAGDDDDRDFQKPLLEAIHQLRDQVKYFWGKGQPKEAEPTEQPLSLAEELAAADLQGGASSLQHPMAQPPVSLGAIPKVFPKRGSQTDKSNPLTRIKEPAKPKPHDPIEWSLGEEIESSDDEDDYVPTRRPRVKIPVVQDPPSDPKLLNNIVKTALISLFNENPHLLRPANDSQSNRDQQTSRPPQGSRLETERSRPSTNRPPGPWINLQQPYDQHRHDRSKLKLYKWGLKFSGDGTDELTLNKFLEDVEQRRLSRGLTRDDVFHSFGDLLDGSAQIWYRANRHRFLTWADLLQALRKCFLDPDFDDKLLEEIKNRTQANNESPEIFFAKVKCLFGRLSYPLNEAEKLKIIEKNLKPEHLPFIPRLTYTSIDELEMQLSELEIWTKRAQTYKEPPSRGMLEPDLSFSGKKKFLPSVLPQLRPSQLCQVHLRLFSILSQRLKLQSEKGMFVGIAGI
ncbi:hypothetical protein GE061_010280 [Apolygus lucorum]|uniref:Retrotransposon gag domain-containing protein n=1 Tax=Apolygus lucorum TaxID=248454 RepID=A0A6A4J3N0_APOLU|nr:hypothetical protein GE061_010280 [Apolygus lucorum]